MHMYTGVRTLDSDNTDMTASSCNETDQATIQSAYSGEGISGLYKGFSAAACRIVVYSSLRFGLYDSIKIILGANGRDSPAWMNVLARLTAGTIAAAIASPTDLLTTRMMSHQDKPLTLRGTTKTILQECGFKGINRGINSSMTCAVILTGTKMGCYDTVKQEFRKKGWRVGPGLIFIAASATGLAIAATTIPVTNARTLITSSRHGTYTGILDCLSDIVRKQDRIGLFRWIFRPMASIWSI